MVCPRVRTHDWMVSRLLDVLPKRWSEHQMRTFGTSPGHVQDMSGTSAAKSGPHTIIPREQRIANHHQSPESPRCRVPTMSISCLEKWCICLAFEVFSTYQSLCCRKMDHKICSPYSTKRAEECQPSPIKLPRRIPNQRSTSWKCLLHPPNPQLWPTETSSRKKGLRILVCPVSPAASLLVIPAILPMPCSMSFLSRELQVIAKNKLEWQQKAVT